MRVVLAQDTCPAKLGKGEVKRVPRNPQYLAGYVVGCPACGFINQITADEQQFTEDAKAGLTMQPGYACNRHGCGALFSFDRGEIRMENGPAPTNRVPDR